MKNEFLDRLRAETDSMHRSLEQNGYATRLMSESITVNDYADYLEKMFGFVSVFEQNVLPAAKDLMLAVQPKAGLLADDLSVLGRRTSDVVVVSLQKLADIFDSPAKALGGLYVMEGSTLGGMVIYQHVHRHLGAAVENSAAYFTVHGKETGSRWKQFLERFCMLAQQNDWEEKVIAGAVSTFALLNDWMQDRHQTVMA